VKTYAIGDIHGMYDLFMTAINWIHEDANYQPKRIVCLGDYVDRGPDSRQVLDFIKYTKETIQHPEYTFIRGNHDQMMIEAITRRDDNGWIQHPAYGGATLRCYENHLDRSTGRYDSKALDDHCALIQSLPTWWEDDHRFYVHGYFTPGHAPKDSSINQRLWARPDTSDCDEYDFGKLVVHGHTPQQNYPNVRPWRLNIDTGACYWREHHDGYSEYGRLTVAVWDEEQKLSLWMFSPSVKKPRKLKFKNPPDSKYYK
jgi:serine/threonine protein phosphatase 1